MEDPPRGEGVQGDRAMTERTFQGTQEEAVAISRRSMDTLDTTCGGLDRVVMCVEGDAPAEHYCVRCELDLCDDHYHGTGHEDHNDEDDVTEEKG